MKTIWIRCDDVQRQIGGTACGVFCLANLVEVLMGGDPRKASLDQVLMREHLFKCLSQGKWEVFPKSPGRVEKVKHSLKAFEVSTAITKFKNM